MIPKGMVLLLKQLLPDFDAEKLAAQLTEIQAQAPAFIASLQARFASIDARLERIEKAIIENSMVEQELLSDGHSND